ncbi:MAG TPA: hypothetical protein DCS93_15480 [Microscillaceae bacterium]|nr:hypothetical protein [Microscillaceae bacterium]
MIPFKHYLITVLTMIITISHTFAQKNYRDFFNQKIKAYHVPGLSVVIIRDNKIAYTGVHGIKASDTNEPVTAKTVFSAASLSKPCFAYAVMKLVETGKISLDKPLYQYLPNPDFAHEENYKKITTRMILSHSSGLPNWRNGKLKLRFEPGKKFGYSGEGYVYLMKVVEHILQKPINDIMQTLVFQPLGMLRSSYVWQDSFETDYATPHDYLSCTKPKNKPQKVNIASSLQTTASDYARLVLALLNKKGLKSRTFKNILRPQIKLDKSENLFWGLGWGLQQTQKGKSIWQWGDNGIFKAYALAYPARKEGIVFFANSYNGLRLVPDIVDFVFQDKSPAIERLGYHKLRPTQRMVENLMYQGYEKGIQYFLEDNGLLDTKKIKERYVYNAVRQLNWHQKYNEVKQLLQITLKTFPKSFKAHKTYGDFCMSRGEVKEATKYYVKALRLKPNDQLVTGILKQLPPQKQQGNVTFQLSDYFYAKRVSVAGDFNKWDKTALPLVRKNGIWVGKIDLKPGKYRYKFVIDGIGILDPKHTNTGVGEYGTIHSILVVK